MYHKDSNNKRITQINRHFCGVSIGTFAVNMDDFTYYLIQLCKGGK